MSKEAIKSDKKKEEGPKTVKMGDRLEGRGLDTFDKKALKKVKSICSMYLYVVCCGKGCLHEFVCVCVCLCVCVCVCV